MCVCVCHATGFSRTERRQASTGERARNTERDARASVLGLPSLAATKRHYPRLDTLATHSPSLFLASPSAFAADSVSLSLSLARPLAHSHAHESLAVSVTTANLSRLLLFPPLFTSRIVLRARFCRREGGKGKKGEIVRP